MDRARLAERVWWGRGPAERTARAALVPFGALYGAVMRGRNALYDLGALPSREPAIPAISVGNLSVGGTGKTPIAAWLATELSRRGAHPAIVLRGYGEDEALVHQRLNPAVPVVVGGDRLAAIARAAIGGADVAVLDDAFQHRRVHRVADIVLVSADRWTRRRWHLPAGPWREGLGALRRATLVIVVRKAASRADASRVVETLARAAPHVPVAGAHLAMDQAHRVDGTAIMPACQLVAGQTVRAISAVGDPHSFDRQLEAYGARLDARHFPDHHRFTAAEVDRLASGAAGELALCTLKDAVKLASMWPPAPPLWYVTQSVVIERGGDALTSMLETTFDASHLHFPSAGTHSARHRLHD